MRVYEAGSGVGGTWFWNRYPGAHCDIESMDYSYSFDPQLEQEWAWSERYATQPEILCYINHVADRFELRRDIQFNTRVTAATFDEVTARWTIATDSGDRVTARFCIMATGCLSSTQTPSSPRLEPFRGRWFQTGSWPHEPVDFTGRRVGVIGTGSSAIQAIPVIAEQAAHLYVFQRTPNFSVPAHNAPLDPALVNWVKQHYPERRQQNRTSRSGFVVPTNTNTETPALEAPSDVRVSEFEARWARGGFGLMASFSDLLTNRAANETAAEFVRSKIRATVHHPNVAEGLCPQDYPIGTKRLCVDSGYYETYNRDTVTLVDVRHDPIEEIISTGVRTRDTTYGLDDIVFAIGFDAMTGTLLKIDIHGRGGVTLHETWAYGPTTYLGLMASGFPNLFLITGPGSPSVLSNMIVSIEQHVDWITNFLKYLVEHNVASIEATSSAQDEWVAHVNELGDATLYPLANSWYMGANIPGKPRVFMPYVGGVDRYRAHCDEIAASAYTGFTLTPPYPSVAVA